MIKLKKIKNNKKAQVMALPSPRSIQEEKVRKKKSIFNKKKKEEVQEEEMMVFSGNEDNPELSVIDEGAYKIKDIIAPSGIYRGEVKDGDWLKIDGKYVRPMVMEGYPSSVSIGWMDNLYSYEGDLDVAVHIHPSDDRAALDALTMKIVQLETQFEMESRKGSIKNLTRMQNDIERLYIQRSKLEQSQESLFHVQVAANLYSSDLNSLNKETQQIDNRLRGKKIIMNPTYLQQEEGFNSVMPVGKTQLPDKMRNFNTGALTSAFPFYNADIMHPGGIFIGSNTQTGTPVYIDFFDKTLLNNANATVFGKAGSGKTFFVSLLTMRSAARGIQTVIIDPEGEYMPVTKAMGGAHIFIAPDSKEFINPFDVESEFSINEETGREIERIDLKSKFSDILNLIGIMNQGLTNEQRSVVSYIVARLYEDFGITEDPTSLRVPESTYDEETEMFYTAGEIKRMPQFTDFHNLLEKEAIRTQDTDLQKLVRSLLIFKKGNIYDLFDTQTSPHLRNLAQKPVVTFNVSSLEENILRPIGMYVAMSWTWEKFIKKNPKVKKRIVCDEAWMLVSPNMAGSEYTATFLENTARRIRKRNGGLLVASQNFKEFDASPQGRAVLTNSTVKFLLQQDSVDIQSVKKKFMLSEGESSFLVRAQRGEMLIRIQTESAVCRVIGFQKEVELIDRAKEYIGGIGLSSHHE